MLEPWVMDLDWLDLLPGKSALMLARGRRSEVTPRMINTMKKIDQNPGLTCNDLRASVPGLDEVSRRTVNDVILQDLGLPSRVAVKKPLLTPPQVAETDFIYTYLF